MKSKKDITESGKVMTSVDIGVLKKVDKDILELDCKGESVVIRFNDVIKANLFY